MALRSRGLTGLTYDQMAQRIGDANIQTANGLNKTFGSFKDALNNGRTGSEAAYDWVTTEEQDAQGNNIPVTASTVFPAARTRCWDRTSPSLRCCGRKSRDRP